MSSKVGGEFGKIRSFLWPIHSYELKKIIPMLLMFFCICLNYSLLRNLKDTLVVNGDKEVGAYVIPYLKFWGVLPFAILAMLLYSKVSNMVSKRALFILSILPFFLFFFLFAFFLYPHSDTLHFSNLNLKFAPAGFTAMIKMWTFSLFFIFAELWGSVVMSLLFWGLANDITKIEESKRFYGLFGIGANIALDVAGRVTQYLAKTNKAAALKLSGGSDLSFSIQSIVVIVLCSSIGVLCAHWFICEKVLTDPRLYDPAKTKKKKKKQKMSLGESFSYLAKSKHLLFIAILVIAYGISINLVEVTWKSMLKEYYTNSIDYLSFMGRYNTYTAWATIFFMLFLTGNVLRIFGWKVTAMVTPVVLLITGVAFFALVIFRENLQASFVAVDILFLIVAIGTAQNVMSKSSKYALFDPTKEMVYIPLDDETKVKGKAAVDVVAARFGKAGGSLVQQIVYALVPLIGLTSPAPMIGIIVTFIISIWIYSVNSLAKHFDKSVEESEAQ